MLICGLARSSILSSCSMSRTRCSSCFLSAGSWLILIFSKRSLDSFLSFRARSSADSLRSGFFGGAPSGFSFIAVSIRVRRSSRTCRSPIAVLIRWRSCSSVAFGTAASRRAISFRRASSVSGAAPEPFAPLSCSAAGAAGTTTTSADGGRPGIRSQSSPASIAAANARGTSVAAGRWRTAGDAAARPSTSFSAVSRPKSARHRPQPSRCSRTRAAASASRKPYARSWRSTIRHSMGSLLLKGAADLPDGAEEPDAQVFDGDVQMGGDVARGNAVDQVEEQRRALLGVERLQRAADAGELVPQLEGPVGGQLFDAGLGDPGLRADIAAAEGVADDVGRDGEDPVFERGVGLVGVDAAEDAETGLLDGILRVVEAAEPGARQGQERRPEPLQ